MSSSTTLAIYRMPIARAAEVGHIRVVIDRHQQRYVEGSRVATATPSGDFLILKLANEQVYYVKAKDYERIQTPSGPGGKRRRAGGRGGQG
jgi:hypothetical protein